MISIIIFENQWKKFIKLREWHKTSGCVILENVWLYSIVKNEGWGIRWPTSDY